MQGLFHSTVGLITNQAKLWQIRLKKESLECKVEFLRTRTLYNTYKITYVDKLIKEIDEKALLNQP